MTKLAKQEITLDQNDMIFFFGNYNSKGRTLVRTVKDVVTRAVFDVTTGFVTIDGVTIKVVDCGTSWKPTNKQ